MSDVSLSEEQKSDLKRLTEIGSLKKDTWSFRLFSVVAAAWSLFQLSLPEFLLLGSHYVRAIHLAFAITLVYLSHRVLRPGKLWDRARSRPGFSWFLVHHIPAVDLVLAVVACFSALYLAIDYEGIATRQGNPSTRDIVVGLTLIVLLLEAARRALGPALPIIASAFIAYSMLSEYMPSFIALRSASLSKIVNKLVLSTEGIYGVPLDVSANTVFLFVLFGAMLERVGGGHYFIQLAFSLLGRYKGGPAKAAVLASGLTGMVSGSSIANTVTTGTFTIPLMKKAGYSGVKAGAIEVAASTNGQLMPPIMGAAAFIIAEYCNMPYLEVVKSAFIPAVVSYIALIYITHLEASKLGLKGVDPATLPRFGQVLLTGMHFLLPLGFLIYLLVALRVSPQLAAYYAILILALLVLGGETFKELRSGGRWSTGVRRALGMLWESLVGGGQAMLSIGVAVAAAGIIVGVVTLGLGGVITELIGLLSGGNIMLLLLITAVTSLLLGMGLPTTANYIVMASLTVPVIVVVGSNNGFEVPLIAAHLFCFYFGILADDTPPVGLAAYAASAISREDPIQTGIQGFIYDMRTAILPFVFIFNTDMLLIGVDSWGWAAMVFLASLAGMFAFASITQGWLVRRCRWWEMAALALVTGILLRPGFFDSWMELGRMGWYVAGITLFLALAAFQKWAPSGTNLESSAS